MPLYATPLVNHKLIEHVTEYLQTLDPAYFPFTAKFDDEQRRAFVRDLRIGLSDLTESGAKRGTSSTGYITSDKRLRRLVQDWADADGGWPIGQDPRNPMGITSIGRAQLAQGWTPAAVAAGTSANEPLAAIEGDGITLESAAVTGTLTDESVVGSDVSETDRHAKGTLPVNAEDDFELPVEGAAEAGVVANDDTLSIDAAGYDEGVEDALTSDLGADESGLDINAAGVDSPSGFTGDGALADADADAIGGDTDVQGELPADTEIIIEETVVEYEVTEIVEDDVQVASETAHGVASDASLGDNGSSDFDLPVDGATEPGLAAGGSDDDSVDFDQELAGATEPVGQADGSASASRSSKLPTEGEGTDWVPGNESHDAPDGFPIKGNANSGIYHPLESPGYSNTIAEIYFRDGQTAEKHGYRLPKNMSATAATAGESAAAEVAVVQQESPITEVTASDAKRSSKLPTGGEGTDWVPGNESHDVPDGFPIKGNANSGIYHPLESPGYGNTIAEIYFRDGETAEKFGYRLPKNMQRKND